MCLGPNASSIAVRVSQTGVDGMSPEGWNESGLGWAGSGQPCGVLSLQRMSLGVTQRRCSSKGSSVDSARGVGGSPVVSRVGSNV